MPFTCECENGDCVKESGKTVCKCFPEYGQYSTTKCKACECGKDSNCTFEGGWFKDTKTCICKKGYKDVEGICKGPCSPNPCINGGTCLDIPNSFKCSCLTGYTGEICDKRITTKATPSTTSSTTSKKATPSTASTMTATSARTSTLSSSTTQTASTTVLAKRTSSTISSTHSTKTSPSTISTKTSTVSSTHSTKTSPSTILTKRTSSTVSSTYSMKTSPSTISTKTSTVSSTHSTKTSPSTILTKRTSSTVSSTYSMKTSPSSTSPSAILNKTSTMITQSTLSTTLIPKTTHTNLETSSTINGTSDIARTTTQSYPHTSSKMPYKICKSNHCKNGGTCIEETDGQKCLCPYPYGGLVCEDSQWCAEGMGKTLCSSNNCQFNFTTNVGYCECPKDQYYDYAERSCEVIDKCPLMTTKCRGINEECRNSDCHCKEHFKRNSEKKCIPNFCETKSNPCGENGFCEDLLDDPGNVKCTCKEGYLFNGKTCEKVNKCDLPGTLGCSQICHPADESCDCRPGFTLHSDNKTCRISKPSSQCKKNNCGVGLCVTTGGRDICICPRTHKAKGLKCIDLCTAKEYPKGICPGDACLPDEKLGFKCKCEGKLTYDKNGVTCRRKLMCSEGNGTKTCAAKSAICVEDFDAPAGYRCECSKNQEKDADGVCRGLCELKKYQELCKQRSAVCDINGLNNCKCPPLLAFDDQERCTVIAQASYTAVLPLASTHYISNLQYSPSQAESGSFVDYDAITKDLQASMHLLFGPNYKFADVLSCNNSSKTLTCTVEIQFNSDPKEQLKLITQPGTCISSNSEDCFIPPALTLRKKEIKPDIITSTDPCKEDIKNKICGPYMVCNKAQDGSRNFECKCSQGFSSFGFYQPFSDKQTIIHKCQDINECLLSNACPNGTKCLNTYGSFECPCQEGYKPLKEHSDTKIVGCAEICDSKLCVHGTCEVIGAQFRCKCDSGYTGLNCDEEATVAGKKGMRIALIVMSSVVVPLLLLAIFMIHKYRILKKKSYKSSYLDDGYSSIGLVPMRN
ncbi:neurogenic locus Notch protein-like [Stegodyphus dumicola]|uniref:neurogenic locus Notch protein-like n=1 Tax=Stegodyphus dumicola TaxID=202533 RepID=UPI0015A81EDD|nr:neurogenic locus Notch protein-like [Stegodyphus dumicola]